MISIRKIFIFFIRLYRIFLSPLFGSSCRFEPSCSHYAEDAINKHGAIRGTALGIWRILRCNPLSPGGYDPVK